MIQRDKYITSFNLYLIVHVSIFFLRGSDSVRQILVYCIAQKRESMVVSRIFLRNGLLWKMYLHVLRGWLEAKKNYKGQKNTNVSGGQFFKVTKHNIYQNWVYQSLSQ